MYCVLAGEKVFTLHPPCDAPFLYEKPYAVGRHALATVAGQQQWVVEPSTEARLTLHFAGCSLAVADMCCLCSLPWPG